MEKFELYLAPMVRVSTLPMRLLCLDYGADMVYTPEIIDRAIIGAKRVTRNDVIEYVKDDRVVFSTVAREKSKLVLQLGTADPSLALKAIETVSRDVDFVNINSGCPKRFSIQGGMGAALLRDPEKLCSILSTLVENSTKTISVKIRMMDSVLV